LAVQQPARIQAVVFFVRQYPPNVQRSDPEVDHSNKPVMIAGDVKYISVIADIIYRGQCLFYILEFAPVSCTCLPVPVIQSTCAPWMAAYKLVNSRPGNNNHSWGLLSFIFFFRFIFDKK
jgi:hypothetical protein